MKIKVTGKTNGYFRNVSQTPDTYHKVQQGYQAIMTNLIVQLSLVNWDWVWVWEVGPIGPICGWTQSDGSMRFWHKHLKYLRSIGIYKDPLSALHLILFAHPPAAFSFPLFQIRVAERYNVS